MVSLKEMLGLILPYIRNRLMEQVKAVALVVSYLILFQTMILGIPLVDSSVIAVGLTLVIFGLTLFMEGLTLGLMPLGEVIGLKLPVKSKLAVILIFSFILGIGATFAEPAIGVLKAAGSSVKAWEAPLLFLLLNKKSALLVNFVGIGVGVAVVFGMLRFLYKWSLKPFIYILVTIVSIATVIGFFDENLLHLTGLAWDCGAVTTGPVTVPLVLALGIGISRVVGGGGDGGGFGVVTLASIFPIMAVLILGFALNGSVPDPMAKQDFFSEANKASSMSLFENEDEFNQYKNANTGEGFAAAAQSGDSAGIDVKEVVTRNTFAAAQAILPLTIFLLLVLFFVLRDKLPQTDEIMFGVALAFVGMGIFNIGIEFGLSMIGNQVGSKLPSSYMTIELTDQARVIQSFDKSLVKKAVSEDGSQVDFFYAKDGNKIEPLVFKPERFNEDNSEYNLVPTRGPLFGTEGGVTGLIVVLLFAFFMGYGATMAEPALNALGATVEEITVGAFRKSVLMQAVALGVGVGLTLGVAKIVWNIPLAYMLVPPYILLFFITYLSTEEFVNIGWDSAGVTTGPITVPLVLAMGLGIGGQAGVVEGFGILAMASVCPILSVLLVGMHVTRKRKQEIVEA